MDQCFKIVFRLYAEIWDFLKANQKMLGITLLLLAETGVYYWLNAAVDWQYAAYVEETIGQYPNMFAFIFIENLKVSGRMIFAGLVPIFLGVLFSGAMTVRGLMATFKQLALTIPIYRILLCTFPHGIFELPALILSMALACILSKEITSLIFPFLRKESGIFRLKRYLREIALCWVFVVIPLLLIGALVEVTLSTQISFFCFRRCNS